MLLMKEVSIVKLMCGGGGGDIQGTEGYVKERRGGIEWERRGRKNAEVHINACKTAVFHLDSGSLSKNSSIAFFFFFFCTWSKSPVTHKHWWWKEKDSYIQPQMLQEQNVWQKISPQRIQKKNCLKYSCKYSKCAIFLCLFVLLFFKESLLSYK